jgi:hypothetical protein
MIFTDLAKTVAQYAPYLGLAIANPGLGAVALISEIAKKFGGSFGDTNDLISRINLDPERQVKLAEIERDKQVEIEKLALEKIKASNADLQDARASNLKNTKKTDEFIKVFLATSLTTVIFFCLYVLKTDNIHGTEANIISTILGSAFTALLAMVYSYYGNPSIRETTWKST